MVTVLRGTHSLTKERKTVTSDHARQTLIRNKLKLAKSAQTPHVRYTHLREKGEW